MKDTINLLNLTQESLNNFFAELGEKPYRTKQFMQWVYHKDQLDFNQMLNLSKGLREKIE